MAQNSGAYYEGLQYASQGVEPVNFGELSMGFAKIKEDQRLEKKRDQERKESTQMEMTKLFGEEIYSAFDGTGLADVDIVNSKIKDSIIARSNVLNSMFEKGELTAPQLMQEMNKIASQSKKYASFANSISSKMEEIQKLGGDASEYTTFMLQNLDGLMKNATPVMDSSGNLSFLSKDGEEIVSNPFNELDRILDVRKKYDVNSVINNVISSKAKQRTVKGNKVIEGYSAIGASDEAAFRSIVSTLDDADRFDIAQRVGIPVERAKGSYLKITNQDEVDNAIVEYMKTTAQGKLDQLTSVDEVAGKQLSIQLNQDYRAAENFKKENQNAVINVVGDKEEDQEIQVFPPPGKNVIVKSIVAGDKTIPVGNIGNYIVNNKGEHKVTVSYTTMVPEQQVSGTRPAGMKEVLVTEDLILDDPATINQVRSQFGMDPISERAKPVVSKPKPY